MTLQWNKNTDHNQWWYKPSTTLPLSLQNNFQVSNFAGLVSPGSWRGCEPLNQLHPEGATCSSCPSCRIASLFVPLLWDSERDGVVKIPKISSKHRPIFSSVAAASPCTASVRSKNKKKKPYGAIFTDPFQNGSVWSHSLSLKKTNQTQHQQQHFGHLRNSKETKSLKTPALCVTVSLEERGLSMGKDDSRILLFQTHPVPALWEHQTASVLCDSSLLWCGHCKGGALWNYFQFQWMELEL